MKSAGSVNMHVNTAAQVF